MGEVQIEKVTGLEFRFQVSSASGHGPPPRYKMVVATAIGLYPLVLVVLLFWPMRSRPLPRPPAVLLSTLCIVLLMTCAVMPIVTGGLARWLFPS